MLQRENLQNSELDSVRFDLALAVSVMRYASDRHIGRVNPRCTTFGFDSANRLARRNYIITTSCTLRLRRSSGSWLLAGKQRSCKGLSSACKESRNGAHGFREATKLLFRTTADLGHGGAARLLWRQLSLGYSHR